MDLRVGFQKLVLFLCILILFPGYISSASSKECNADHKVIPIKGTIKTAGHTKAEYPALAKVSCMEAIKVATDLISGKVIECKLEDEDGFLVYGVEIMSKDNTMIEVQVDAGSGRALASEEDRPE